MFVLQEQKGGTNVMKDNKENRNITPEDVINAIKVFSETAIDLVPVFAAAFKSLKKIENYIDHLKK